MSVSMSPSREAPFIVRSGDVVEKLAKSATVCSPSSCGVEADKLLFRALELRGTSRVTDETLYDHRVETVTSIEIFRQLTQDGEDLVTLFRYQNYHWEERCPVDRDERSPSSPM